MKPRPTQQKVQKPQQSPLPSSIDVEIILLVLEGMLKNPGAFFISSMENLDVAEGIVQEIDPDLRFLHLPDARTKAVITAIARIIAAQKITDTPPVAPCKCR